MMPDDRTARRWRRPAGFAACLILALSAAAVGVSIHGRSRLQHAKERFVQDVGPLELSAYELPEIAAERNAAFWLLSGAESFEASHEELQAMGDLLAVLPDRMPDASREVVVDLVARNQEVFELLSRSVELAGSSLELAYSKGFETRVPMQVELYRVARLLRADTRLALIDGDGPRVTRNLAILDRLAGALSEESVLVTVMMGLAVDRVFLGTVHDVLALRMASPELLEDLAARLEDRDRTAALRRSFGAEGALVAETGISTLVGEEVSIFDRAGLVLTAPYQRASLLGGWRDLAMTLDRPWAEIRAEYSVPPSNKPRAPWDVHWFILPNILSAVERLKSNNSSALLAREAIELWSGRTGGEPYPVERAMRTGDPYTGEPFVYEVLDQGAVVLAAPGAEDLWRDENPATNFEQTPPFRWQLPAG